MSNTKVYCYILGKDYKNPDRVECCVPTLINHKDIFFGPCKKPLREKMFDNYLRNFISRGSCEINGNECFIGFNASDKSNMVRKIVFAGKIKELMTFEQAYKEFKDGGMDPHFFNNRCSPIHVKPDYDDLGNFRGYIRRSNLHNKKLGHGVYKWHRDFTRKRNKTIKESSEITINPDEIRLNNATQHERIKHFNLDCCFLCEKIFFALGKGMSINDEILNILKEAQTERTDIDNYCIFGRRKDKSIEGKTGNYLEITGKLGDELINIIRKESSKIHTTEEQFQKYKDDFKKWCNGGC